MTIQIDDLTRAMAGGRDGRSVPARERDSSRQAGMFSVLTIRGTQFDVMPSTLPVPPLVDLPSSLRECYDSPTVRFHRGDAVAQSKRRRASL
jgi:hypothetical protein